MTADNATWSEIGYVPHGPRLERPFDRRRFPCYAKMRGLSFRAVTDWKDHDIIVLSPSADVTRWVDAPSDRRIVVDLPDSFPAERRGVRRSFRGLAKWAVGESRRPILNYGRAVERLLERADAVVCGTDEQVRSVSKHATNVHPILDLHSEIKVRRPTINDGTSLDIIWEGLPATLPSIQQMLPALKSLSDRYELRLHLVTDLRYKLYMNRFRTCLTEDVVGSWGIDVSLHQWSVDTLDEVAAGCDIAIVPVDLTDPMAAGKPENRMRIFWRLGLPVVVSPSPANARAAALAGVDREVLCATSDDWRRVLERLYERPDERLRIAEAGQATALSVYSEESLASRWDRLFESL